MSLLRRGGLVALLLALSLTACPGPAVDDTDGGTKDGGSQVTDAGTHDAGTTDAGSP